VEVDDEVEAQVDEVLNHQQKLILIDLPMKKY
jgi:hypothetical protein